LYKFTKNEKFSTTLETYSLCSGYLVTAITGGKWGWDWVMAKGVFSLIYDIFILLLVKMFRFLTYGMSNVNEYNFPSQNSIPPVWETATRNSEISTILVNSLLKSKQALFSLLKALYPLKKLQYLVKRQKKG
jgi:hypothetical protein